MTTAAGWRVPAAIEAVRDRVVADGVVDRLPGFDLVADPTFAGDRGTSEAAHVVGVVGDRRFAAGLDHGLERCCATVMSALQDEVVDRSGRPWPLIGTESGDGGGWVLDVDVDRDGIAVWRRGSEVLCPVGLLVPSVRARGWAVA
ncbi:MAG: hypothetical protein NTW05_01625 [Pseudonocardiales bacterium]|nr:hypothetical protein [Pseudonocardiales bacterium]